MHGLMVFYLGHPMWVWLAVGALLLAAEVATGSGYLLWPAASAVVVGLFTLTGLDLGLPGELALFAVLPLGSTFLARRYLPPTRLQPGPDINDRAASLIGREGQATNDFSLGHGRVLVDGAEWIAEVDGDAQPAAGQTVQVVGVLGGARLKVRPA